MFILGIESTAHTFGVGIIEATDNECIVLANEKDSYSSSDKGMIPNEIADHHRLVADKILEQAFLKASKTWDDIDIIAYSAGPGLDPALWEGYHKATKWAKDHKKQLIPVNHCCAHLSIGKIVNKAKDPAYLYVSGVNTQIIIQDSGKYRVIGETLDIGLGNMLDKLGRILGLGFPAGPAIENLAKNGTYVDLPYTVKGMDTSFSGLLTRAKQIWTSKITKKQLLKKAGRQVKELDESFDQPASSEDLCFSIQEVSFAMMAEVSERAMAHTDKKELILVGGVGANKRLCEMLKIMCEARGAVFYSVPMSLAGDQGAMIAWEGYIRRNEGLVMEVDPHWRTDY